MQHVDRQRPHDIIRLPNLMREFADEAPHKLAQELERKRRAVAWAQVIVDHYVLQLRVVQPLEPRNTPVEVRPRARLDGQLRQHRQALRQVHRREAFHVQLPARHSQRP